MRRPPVALLAALGCLLVAAAPAHGKGAVRATLDDPAALKRAAPGERLRVSWRLADVPRRPDAASHPFGASGIYFRVRPAAGGRRRTFAAHAVIRDGRGVPGRFVATVKVPRAGIASIAIGLKGYRSAPGQEPVRADLFFQIVNDPFD